MQSGTSQQSAPAAPAPNPATKTSRPARTGDTVTVACKLPHGLILRVFDWEEYDEPMRDGTMKASKRAREIPELQFTIRGTSVATGGNLHPEIANEIIPGGYALTRGCPRETWERWKEQNKSSSLIRNKVVFAHNSHESVQQEAIKNVDVKSGMEPIDPANPAARLPGRIDRRLKVSVFKEETE